MPPVRGVITAMVTPFTDQGAIDGDAARRLARRLIDSGCHGIVVAGTTGESPTLDDDEKMSLLELVLDEVGEEATVIAGTGSNDTAHTAELTAKAARAGAHAALVVTPYYNKPNRAGLRAHFEAAAEAGGELPIVLYNIPSRCVINMPPDLLAELATIPNVVAVKQANNAELESIDGLDLLAGNDEIFLRTLEIGGVGGILVSSHLVGPQMREIYDAVAGGDAERAVEIDRRLAPIYEAMTAAPNPIPVKAALEALGVIGGTLRLPLVPASDGERATVRAALERQGLLPSAGAG